MSSTTYFAALSKCFCFGCPHVFCLQILFLTELIPIQVWEDDWHPTSPLWSARLLLGDHFLVCLHKLKKHFLILSWWRTRGRAVSMEKVNALGGWGGGARLGPVLSPLLIFKPSPCSQVNFSVTWELPFIYLSLISFSEEYTFWQLLIIINNSSMSQCFF